MQHPVSLLHLTAMTRTLLVFFVGFCFSNGAFSEDYLLCKRNPTIYPVLAEAPGSDACSGGVKLQGLAYKCGKMAEYEGLNREFLSDLVVKGREECSEICKQRGEDCVGVFSPPEKCAITATPQKAQEFGKNQAKCGPHCEGQTFIYCSLYHSSFLKVEESLFRKHKANCYCRKNSKK